ncbi:hypothetical protein FPV67DRAFT_755444 [Lyophyllum atratum]|nr:hypothetical protein FPV67DRAFT_755444 [Lyophyllum atratum]
MTQLSAYDPSSPAHPLEERAWKSDYILSEAAQQEFRALRDHLQKTLDQHDLEIARVQASLDQLMSQRESYTLRIAKVNSALAPHKKLPPELLAKIFSDCSPKPLCIPPVSLDDIRPILSLPKAVCSLWRQIAQQTPELWDDIVVKYPYASNPIEGWENRTHNITAAAKDVISRGTSTISLNMYGHRRAYLTRDIDPIWNLIVPFASQLTRISISCSPHLLYPFLQSSPLPFDVLESLTLNGEEHPVSAAVEHIPRLGGLGKTPSLRKVVISKFYLDFLRHLAEDAFNLPWDQLTHLTLQNTWIDLATGCSIISRCSSVVHCELSLHATGAQTQIAIQPQPILHPCLQSLKITSTGGSPNVVAEFLQSLDLPSLISIEFGDNDIADIVPSFISLIARSCCTLQKFVISKAAVPFRVLEPVLPVLSSVEELIIPDTLLTDSMIQRISHGALLPNLKCVNCSLTPAPMTLEYFMAMVQNGGPVGSPGLRVASARYLVGSVRHYRAPRWLETTTKFKELSAKLQEEGRILTLKG